MQFKNAATTLALAAAAAAQPVFTTQPTAIVAGQSATWAWTGAAGPVTIILRTGDPKALGVVGTLTGTPNSSGTFTWMVPAGTVNGVYALEIDDGTQPNYSAQFQVTGGASGTIATIATTGVATLQPTASLSTGSATGTSSLPTLLTSSSATGVRNSTMTSSATKSSTSTAATSASTTSVGNLNAAGTISASPFAILITAVLGLFVF